MDDIQFMLRKLTVFCTLEKSLMPMLWTLEKSQSCFSLHWVCESVSSDLLPVVVAYDRAVLAQNNLYRYTQLCNFDAQSLAVQQRLLSANEEHGSEFVKIMSCRQQDVSKREDYVLRCRVLVQDCQRVSAVAERQMQALMLALAIGTHARAGAGSKLHAMDADVLCAIARLCARPPEIPTLGPRPTTMQHLA